MSVCLAARRYGNQFCADPEYTCIHIKRGQSWDSLFPNDNQRELVQRLNRINIPLHSGMKIAVPKKLTQTNLWDISPFPLLINPLGQKMLVVDPGSLAWGAYDPHGNLVNWGPMSGGKSFCSDIGQNCRTIVGKFKFYHKRGANCQSSKFPIGKGGAPMPYCMFFNGGFALHASTSVPGYHASHGCVRLFYEDAKWLNEEFIDAGGANPTMIIVNPYL